jgi:sugar lactone lactonase YvrE
MLAVDGQGNVFVTGEDGVFFEVDGKKQTLQKLAIHAPACAFR